MDVLRADVLTGYICACLKAGGLVIYDDVMSRRFWRVGLVRIWNEGCPGLPAASNLIWVQPIWDDNVELLRMFGSTRLRRKHDLLASMLKYGQRICTSASIHNPINNGNSKGFNSHLMHGNIEKLRGLLEKVNRSVI